VEQRGSQCNGEAKGKGEEVQGVGGRGEVKKLRQKPANTTNHDSEPGEKKNQGGGNAKDGGKRERKKKEQKPDFLGRVQIDKKKEGGKEEQNGVGKRVRKKILRRWTLTMFKKGILEGLGGGEKEKEKRKKNREKKTATAHRGDPGKVMGTLQKKGQKKRGVWTINRGEGNRSYWNQGGDKEKTILGQKNHPQ